MTGEGELQLSTSQLPYLGEGRGGEGREGEGRGGEGRGGEGRRGGIIHFSKAFTACAQLTEGGGGSDLNDPVVGASGKPLVARVDCNAPHPAKMATDNLQEWAGTLLCTPTTLRHS